jgi:hypothetical protein
MFATVLPLYKGLLATYCLFKSMLATYCLVKGMLATYCRFKSMCLECPCVAPLSLRRTRQVGVHALCRYIYILSTLKDVDIKQQAG